MARFKVWDGECGECGEPMRIGHVDSASQAVDEYMFNADYGSEPYTRWIQVWVAEIDDDGVVVDTTGFKVTIEPDAPICLGGHEHDFHSPLSLVGGIEENPGVFGHGGGVIIKEVCLRCGCGRITDTWAQDPYTGEQGLTKISYKADAYDVSRWHDDYSNEEV